MPTCTLASCTAPRSASLLPDPGSPLSHVHRCIRLWPGRNVCTFHTEEQARDHAARVHVRALAWQSRRICITFALSSHGGFPPEETKPSGRKWKLSDGNGREEAAWAGPSAGTPESKRQIQLIEAALQRAPLLPKAAFPSSPSSGINLRISN